jgi:hypothetical protein
VGDEQGEREFTTISMGALLSDGAAVVVDATRKQELVVVAPDGATTTIARPVGARPRSPAQSGSGRWGRAPSSFSTTTIRR